MAKQKTAKTAVPGKNCPKCDAIVGNATRVCSCGHEFYKPLRRNPIKVSNIDVKKAAKFIRQVGSVEKAHAAIREADELRRESE